MIALVVLCCLFSLSGCSLLRYIDGSSQEDIEKAGNPLLWKKVENIEQQNQSLKETDISTANSISSLQGALSKVDNSVQQLKAQIQQVTDGSGAEAVELQKRLGKLEEDSRKIQSELETMKTVAKKPAIKVLSGTSNRESAVKMVARLSKWGFTVEQIDMAPRNNFKKNVVFYAEPHQKTAENISSRIGGETIARPLTWNSRYGIIIVSILK